MANIVIFDKDSKRVIRRVNSAHTPDFQDRDDVLINPDVEGIDLKHARVEGDKLRSGTKEEIAADIRQKNIHEYSMLRQQEYPAVGDQLDAVLKQLNYMQMSGQTDLIQPMDNIIQQWLAVKRKYPSE